MKLMFCGRLPAKGDRRFDQGHIDFILGDGSMIKGFDSGVAGMRVGERRRLHIPAKLGYGKKGKKSKVPPNSDLVFDVLLQNAGAEGGDWGPPGASAMAQKRREAK